MTDPTPSKTKIMLPPLQQSEDANPPAATQAMAKNVNQADDFSKLGLDDRAKVDVEQRVDIEMSQLLGIPLSDGWKEKRRESISEKRRKSSLVPEQGNLHQEYLSLYADKAHNRRGSGIKVAPKEEATPAAAAHAMMTMLGPPPAAQLTPYSPPVVELKQAITMLGPPPPSPVNHWKQEQQEPPRQRRRQRQQKQQEQEQKQQHDNPTLSFPTMSKTSTFQEDHPPLNKHRSFRYALSEKTKSHAVKVKDTQRFDDELSEALEKSMDDKAQRRRQKASYMKFDQAKHKALRKLNLQAVSSRRESVVDLLPTSYGRVTSAHSGGVGAKEASSVTALGPEYYVQEQRLLSQRKEAEAVLGGLTAEQLEAEAKALEQDIYRVMKQHLVVRYASEKDEKALAYKEREGETLHGTEWWERDSTSGSDSDDELLAELDLDQKGGATGEAGTGAGVGAGGGQGRREAPPPEGFEKCEMRAMPSAKSGGMPLRPYVHITEYGAYVDPKMYMAEEGAEPFDLWKELQMLPRRVMVTIVKAVVFVRTNGVAATLKAVWYGMRYPYRLFLRYLERRKVEQRRKARKKEKQRKQLADKYPQYFKKSTRWRAPSMQLAAEKARNKMFQLGHASLWATSTTQMATMGPGIALYFDFLRFMGLYFAVATVICIPNLIINSEGKGMAPSQVDPMGLALLTVGNLGLDPERKNVPTPASMAEPPFCSVSENFDFCNGRVSTIGGEKVDSVLVGWLSVIVDLIYTLGLLRFALWWRTYLFRQAQSFDGNELTASDYSVYVTGLPLTAKEEKIRKFFSKRYRLNIAHEWYPYYLGCIGKARVKGGEQFEKMYQTSSKYRELRHSTVRDTAHVNYKKSYMGGWVAEVNVVHPIGQKIRALQSSRSLFDSMRETIATIRKHAPGSMVRGGRDEGTYEGAIETMLKLDNKYDRVNRKNSSKFRSKVQHFRNTIGAFVTFENVESLDRCVSDYRMDHSWAPDPLRQLLVPQKLKMRGVDKFHCLEVSEAPEPEDIIWENLQVVGLEAAVRQSIAFGLLVVFLLMCFAFVYYAQIKTGEMAESSGDLSLCDQQLPSVFYGRFDFEVAHTEYLSVINPPKLEENATAAPTTVPSPAPTALPTTAPTPVPTIQPTKAPTLSGRCYSVPVDWVDISSDTCDDYVSSGWCNSTGIGPSWPADLDYRAFIKVGYGSALEACCECGGGWTAPSPTPPPTAQPTPAPTVDMTESSTVAPTSAPTTNPTIAPTIMLQLPPALQWLQADEPPAAKDVIADGKLTRLVYDEVLSEQYCEPGSGDFYIYYPYTQAHAFAQQRKAQLDDPGSQAALLQMPHLYDPRLNLPNVTAPDAQGNSVPLGFLSRDAAMREASSIGAGEDRSALCDNPCVSASASRATQCSGLSCFEKMDPWRFEKFNERARSFSRDRLCVEYSSSQPIFCYCQAELDDYMAKYGTISGPAKLISENKVCVQFAQNQILERTLLMMIGFVITFLNTLAESVLKFITDIERRSSKSSQSGSLSVKLFSLEFINTAIVTLVVYARLPNNQKSGLEQFGLLEGDYTDMSRDWYATVGVSIVVTMMLNAVMPHFAVLFELALAAFSRYRAMHGNPEDFDSQDQLDDTLEGGDFEIETRYPVMLNTAFVTLLFSAGMPILLPVASVAFFVCYWVDKYTLIRHSKAPFYDYKLMMSSAKLLPLAAMMHMGISVWTYGNHEIFAAHMLTGEKYYPDIYGENVEQETMTTFVRPGELNPSAVRSYLQTIENMDPFGKEGIALRIAKGHCFMVVVIMLIIVAYAVISVAWKPLWDLVLRRVVALLTAGQWAQFSVTPMEEERDEFVSPYTGDFKREVKYAPLSKVEKKLGFVQTAMTSMKVHASNMRERYRIWTSDGYHRAMVHWRKIKHKKGTKMRSWEAITKIPSYNVLKSKLYRQLLEFGVMAEKLARHNAKMGVLVEVYETRYMKLKKHMNQRLERLQDRIIDAKELAHIYLMTAEGLVRSVWRNLRGVAQFAHDKETAEGGKIIPT